MIDVKKFVVVFLILAAFASSSALILLNFNTASPRAASPVASQPFSAATGGAATGATPPSIANAFMPSSAQPADADASSSDPNNITARVADSMATQFFAANPDGPRDDGNGNQVIAVPTAESVLANVSSSSASGTLEAPDWDFDAAMQTVRIATSSTPADVAQYSQALSSIINDRFIKTDLPSVVSSSIATPDSIPFVLAQISGALDDISGLTVPKNLADFHEGFIKMLVYEKNALTLTQSSADDPVKAILVLQAEQGKYDAAMTDFQNALQDAMQKKTFSLALPETVPVRQTGAIAFFENTFGIRTAHAQWVVTDPVTEVETTLTTAQLVWRILNAILVQEAKNLAIAELQKSVIRFVQNGGNPRFVQNWGGLLSDAFDVAAGSALGQITPGLCADFGVNVSGWLKNAFPTANAIPGGVTLNGAVGTNCTLQNSVSDVSGFYNDFNTGGWNGFTALLSPNNNPFGAFAEAYDNIQTVGGSAQTAAQNKAIAGAGYTSQAICDDGGQPGKGGLCADGTEPFVMTPGKNLSDTVSKNLNSTIDLIVNIDSQTNALTVATILVNAFISQLITSGERGLMNAL